MNLQQIHRQKIVYKHASMYACEQIYYILYFLLSFWFIDPLSTNPQSFRRMSVFIIDVVWNSRFFSNKTTCPKIFLNVSQGIFCYIQILVAMGDIALLILSALNWKSTLDIDSIVSPSFIFAVAVALFFELSTIACF